MNRWLFHQLAFITLFLLLSLNSPVSAKSDQGEFFGWGIVTNQTSPGKCITPDHLQICWNRAAVMKVETSDSRFTGEVNLIFDSIYTQVPYSGSVKGEFILNNAGGSWEGTWKGTSKAQGDTLFMGAGRGQGDYEGLFIHWQMKRLGSNWRATMSVMGSISKPSLPARKR